MFSQTTLIVVPFLATGVILIVASLFMRKKTGSTQNEILDNTVTETVNQQIEKSITDADNAMEQMNRMSAMILDELENKYKELLFLYQLIDDKKIEVENLISKTASFNEPSLYTAPNEVSGYSYYENPPAYQAEPQIMNTGAYSNPIYNKRPDSNSEVMPPKITGGIMLESNILPKSAETVELKYSSDKVPKQYAEKFKDIIQLTNEGKAPSEIAQRLNMGQGEVKLILTLARVRQD